VRIFPPSGIGCEQTSTVGEKHVVVPKQVVILLSGILATGKSTFAHHLACEHGFAHYDLERYPRGWPRPELKGMWDADRSAFIAQVRQHHDRIALDWGFPVSCLSWVEELPNCGVKLVWFDGDIVIAREIFVQRSGIAVEEFDKQVAEIRKAKFPSLLDCVVVRALSDNSVSLDVHQIERIIFT
jgi:hypothetical protein